MPQGKLRQCLSHYHGWCGRPHLDGSKCQAWRMWRHNEGDIHEKVYQNRRRSGKRYIQIHALESKDGRAVKRKLPRSKFLEFFADVAPCSSHGGLRLGALLGAPASRDGHDVRLMRRLTSRPMSSAARTTRSTRRFAAKACRGPTCALCRSRARNSKRH